MNDYTSELIYKGTLNKEVTNNIQLILDKNFINITSDIKSSKGVKNWKAQNKITNGHLVTFGSQKYFSSNFISIQQF